MCQGAFFKGRPIMCRFKLYTRGTSGCKNILRKVSFSSVPMLKEAFINPSLTFVSATAEDSHK